MGKSKKKRSSEKKRRSSKRNSKSKENTMTISVSGDNNKSEFVVDEEEPKNVCCLGLSTGVWVGIASGIATLVGIIVAVIVVASRRENAEERREAILFA